MIAKIYSATLYGIDAKIVQIEVDSSNGLPAMNIVGLAGASIKESKERIRSCLRSSNYEYPICRLSINLSPADIFKAGTQFDLGIALGILVSSGQLKVDFAATSLFLGEISLDGLLRPVRGVTAMVLSARARGITKIFLPRQNMREAGFIQGVEIFAYDDFTTLAADLKSNQLVSAAALEPLVPADLPDDLDFANIHGQNFAKRGLEIAVAGGHNILMVGPPGSGKTLLARSLISILPKPSQEELLAILKIHSIAGEIPKFLARPFRAPHHSVSLPAFLGGGVVLQPGEISLAHCGVLFLDELPEFKREVVESLREPLESGEFRIARLHNNYLMPARFIFVAAQNPCPCGYAGDATVRCKCTAAQVLNYRRKVSGPILDRIDLQINLSRSKIGQATEFKEESSKAISERINTARKVQLERFGVALNSNADQNRYSEYFSPNFEARKFLDQAAEKYFFSWRGYFRVVRVARTIADLGNSKLILLEHIAEALQYRFG